MAGKQLTVQEGVNMIRSNLEASRPKFAATLPAHINPDRFVRSVLGVMNTSPQLQRVAQYPAARRSILNSCMKAATDGLVLDSREAALVTFGKDDQAVVTYMPMIAGVLKKLRNSGALSTISAHVVYEKDRFAYILGDDERIEHEPYRGGKRGAPIGAYAIAKLKDGGVQRMFMDVTEIEEVRAVSRAKNAGPWKEWWGEMAKKTVIRRLCKYLPSSADIEQMWENDNASYEYDERTDSASPAGDDAIVIDQEPADEGPKETKAAAKVKAAAKKKAAAEPEDAGDVIESEIIEGEADDAGTYDGEAAETAGDEDLI